MDYCFCNITALEILRCLDTIQSVAFEPNPMAILKSCNISCHGRAHTFVETLGIDCSKSIHLLTGNLALSGEAKNTARHVVTSKLPPRSIFQLDDGVYCTSPEETFVNLALHLYLNTPKDLLFKAEAKLAMWGMELCGLFYFDSQSQTLHERQTAITSKAKISAYLSKFRHRPGIVFAQKSLVHVEDRMRSPMEASCALLLCRTRRIGSLGLPLGEANCSIETSGGIREVDRIWKQFGLGYEYQGREYHTTETRKQEDRRRNALLGSGITIVNIWYEDLFQPQAFNQLAQTLFKTMGKRLRIRDDSFAWRQQQLRSVVLPSLNRYE